MAVAVATNRKTHRHRASPVPRALRARVERLMGENYAYMDSPIFRNRSIEKELFTFEDREPELPLTSWYQPTREDPESPLKGTPQLMKGPEERVMFLRFNYAKLRLSRLKVKIRRQGLNKKLAVQFLEWHRRFEHFREYL